MVHVYFREHLATGSHAASVGHVSQRRQQSFVSHNCRIVQIKRKKTRRGEGRGGFVRDIEKYWFLFFNFYV
jgi:hypothetical protein